MGIEDDIKEIKEQVNLLVFQMNGMQERLDKLLEKEQLKDRQDKEKAIKDAFIEQAKPCKHGRITAACEKCKHTLKG